MTNALVLTPITVIDVLAELCAARTALNRANAALERAGNDLT